MSRRKPKTKQWLQERRRDGYARLARQHGYRSRAVYKLEEIDRRENLVKPGMRVLELGASPGGWSQYLARKVGEGGLVVAVDLIDMEPIPSVRLVQGDFSEPNVQRRLVDAVGEADLVISDMAPNITGIREADRARFLELLEAALDLSRRTLRSGGTMLLKVFEGPEIQGFRQECRRNFSEVVVRKPSASRSKSSEYYLLARRFRRDTERNCL